MRLRLLVEVECDDAAVARIAEYIAAQRQVMVDPGGDELGLIGPLMGAVPVEDRT
jgi:hypothetical protein